MLGNKLEQPDKAIHTKNVLVKDTSCGATEQEIVQKLTDGTGHVSFMKFWSMYGRFKEFTEPMNPFIESLRNGFVFKADSQWRGFPENVAGCTEWWNK